MPTDSQHISHQFEIELEDIRSEVLAMGGLIEQQVSDALESIVTADTELAREVIAKDEQVNDMEVGIDEQCTQIIALRQPAAGDLRLVTSILKTINDLERVGDEACSIARMSLNLAAKDRPKQNYRELLVLGHHVQGMLSDALDAFARNDVDQAVRITVEDEEIDAEYEAIVRQLITYMMEDPRTVSRAIDMMWSARSLERIGDHARNVCEQIIYMIEGKNVRHMSTNEIEEVISED
jgi:phosphate transport system protein